MLEALGENSDMYTEKLAKNSSNYLKSQEKESVITVCSLFIDK